MMKKVMKNMEDGMDNLIMERKEIPIYIKNLYKWIPEPSILKEDVHWDIPTLESLECPYCSNKDSIDLYYDEDIFIYVDPKGYLRFGTSDGVGRIEIQFCPMCGKSLK